MPVEANARSDGVELRAYLDADTYRSSQQLWLTVELTIEPGLHIYGKPIPEGYIPLSIAVAPLDGLVMGAPQWPAPHPYRVEWLEEELFVYEGKVAVPLPLTFTQAEGDQTLQVTVRYQACSDTDCFLPSTARLQLPVKAVGDETVF
ncbi:MAG: protein-disulfide reductase DsbD N-terminal domain-containing protein [Candidatus Entotheonellia bacterium]